MNIGSVKQAIRRGAQTLALGYLRVKTLLQLIGVVVWRFKTLAQADRIYLCPIGGFGISLLIPDWLRRMFPGDRCLTLFGYVPEHLNPYCTDLWGRDKLVYIPTTAAIPGRGFVTEKSWTLTLFAILEFCIRRLFPNTQIIRATDIKAITPHPAGVELEARLISKTFPCFYRLATASAPELHLPAALIADIKNRLEGITGPQFKRRATLFIRHKGGEIDQSSTTSTRSGSALSDHIGAIEHLIRRGYQVLLVGDVEITPGVRDALGHGLVDHVSLGAERDLFRMFAGTETDVFIGQLSGGCGFVHVNNLPALIINAYPFAACYPHATMHYKTLQTKDGDLVSPQELFTTYSVYADLGENVLVNNSPEQITKAVTEFIDNIDAQRPFGVHVSALNLASKVATFEYCDARISPAWLDIFNAGQNS